MAEIFHARFDSGLDSFSAGTRVTTQGSAVLGDVDGALEIGAGVTATRDFTNVTTGFARVDVWARLTDASAGAASTATLFYLLPNGGTVASGSSIATVSLNRPGGGSTSALCEIAYRNNAGSFVVWTGTLLIPRVEWHKFSFVVDFAAKTVDYYLGDVMFMKSIPWVDTGLAGLGRIAFVGSASAPATWFDNIRVEDAWTKGESVLVDHTFTGGSGEIEASTPTTSLRDAHAQPWYIAPNTATYGAFTLGAGGATPDASKPCFALQRCGKDGVIEVEFQTPASGNAYIGIIFRFWDFLTATGGGAGIFRVSGGSSNAALFLPDRSGNIQTVQSVSQSLTTNTTYTLRIEMRGRVYIGSIKAAAMTSGSYTTLFTHTASSSALGGRGMLMEELCGPYIDSSLGTADVRRFRYTGKGEVSEAAKTIGRVKWGVGHGSVREAYYLDSAATTRNLFWSRGVQYGHRSSADMAGQQQQQVIYDAANVYATRQTGSSLTEYQHIGFADCYLTLLHRGPWVSDGVLPTDTSENFAPDFDLRPTTWASAFLSAIDSGSATYRNDSPYHDWVTHNSSVTLPAGQQSLTAYGSGQEAHISQIVIADGTVPSAAWNVNSKWEGNGDPISRAVSVQGTSFSAGVNLRVARAHLFRPASALDGATLTAWRDNLASPGTLTFTTGSAKTDAPGDTGATGFNRRHGWHEITCSGGTAAWTLPVASGTRHWPVFRLHGWTSTNTELAINGTSASNGTDYVIDDLGGGVAVLQVLSDRTADTTFAMSAGASVPPAGTVTISAVDPATTSAEVTYSYSDSDQDSFEYRLDGGSPAAIGASPATITGLTAATAYSIQVRAKNAAGESAWSDAVAFTTDALPSVPVISDPASASVRLGLSAVFSVSATGNPTPTYQWQRNPGGVGSWANVTTGSGGTTATYTTAAVAESGGDANDGDTYRCIATNSEGSDTSGAATLNVLPASTDAGITGPLTRALSSDLTKGL